MGNNNNISAFEKVIFVDKIDNEYDAKELSESYPFAYIITEKTEEGLNNGILVDSNNNIIREKNINNVQRPNQSSGNIWKGGQRLTKFVNVDSTKNTTEFDAYNLKLEFNQETGLLSFLKIPKIDNYKIISLFYKHIYTNENQEQVVGVKKYVNKQNILNDQQNNVLPSIFSEDVNLTSLNNYDDINQIDDDTIQLKTANISEKNTQNQGFIDAIDNKVYLVLRFEAQSIATLNTVSNASFNISAAEENIINITKNASPITSNKTLSDFTGITDNDILNDIAKVTFKYTYSSEQIKNKSNIISPCKYFIYELELKDKTSEQGHMNLGFNFENASYLYPFNLGVDQLFLNPTSYKLYINNIEVNLENDDLTIYVMPGTNVNCKLELYPNKISNYALTVTSNVANNRHFTFSNNDEDLSSLTILSDVNPYTANNNIFEFIIKSTPVYDFNSESYDSSETRLSFELKKYDRTNNTQSERAHWVDHVKIRKYNWDAWQYNTLNSIENPFGTSLVTAEATSCSQLSFIPGKIYAVFNIPGNTSSEEYESKLLDITTETQITWHFEPGDDYEIDGQTYKNNADYQNNDVSTVGLPQTSQLTDSKQRFSINVPFIFRASENAKFWWTYSHKTALPVEGDKIHINPAVITSINIENGITFNDIETEDPVNSIESGQSVEIKRSEDESKYIKFYYLNSNKPINAYKYLYKTLSNFKESIKIGLSETLLDENGKIKSDNVTPYVEIKNNKLIYNADDARSSNKIIELQLTYNDPNYNQTINSIDTIKLTVNKLLIDYWIYVGEVYNITKNNTTNDVTGYDAIIPDIPEGIPSNSRAHIIECGPALIDNPDLQWAGDCYCGVLYQYADRNNPSYSDINSENYDPLKPVINDIDNQNLVRETSFGTWIHIGNENEIQNCGLPGADTDRVFEGDSKNKIFGGNTDYMILILPDVFKPNNIFDNISWAWGNIPQPSYIFKKGFYKGYVIPNEQQSYNPNSEDDENYDENETILWSEGYPYNISFK